MAVGTQAAVGLLVLAVVGSAAYGGTSCERVARPRSGNVPVDCDLVTRRGNEGVARALSTTRDVDAEVVQGAAGRVVTTFAAKASEEPGRHRGQASAADAGLVGNDRVSFPMNDAEPTEEAADAGEWFEEHRDVAGRVVRGWAPRAARAAVPLGERGGFERQQLASARRQNASQARGGGLRGFFAGLDLQGRFGFSSSAGRDPTFALTTRFRRPYLFSAAGERNQIAFGPEATLRANSSDQDDENSIVVSVPLTITHSRGPIVVPLTGPEVSPNEPLVNAFVLNVGPRLEVDKGFGSGNFVPDGEFGLGLAIFGGESQALDAWPYVGVEAGMGLIGGQDTSGVGSVSFDAPESIVRVKAGVDARVFVYRVIRQ